MNFLIENFINKDKENEALFIKFRLCNDEKALEELNMKFKVYMFQLRFLSYINKSMIFYSIKYKEKKVKNENREILNLNVKSEGFEEERISRISDEELDFIEEISKPGEEVDFKKTIENPSLLNALEKLPDRQKEIIYKMMVLNKSQNELIKELGVSRQSINKSKNLALNKLKNELMEVG
ncbi:MAG: sigma-70 family RNA polymerase sigma factor [Clostridium sp.]|uniref:sigma-70 family RNA polymerase sigma factor n=1 Tax=Clostridium sp. TaxID=1506 RepID=UPI003D6CAA96